MVGLFFEEFLTYFSKNWASLLSWSLLTLFLIIVRYYQIKWVKAKREVLKSQNVVRMQSAKIIPSIRTDEIFALKHQCDALEELIAATHKKLDDNNQTIDKEVLELVYQIGAQTQGRVKNVE